MAGVIKTQIRDAVRGAVAAGVTEVDLCALLTSVLQTIVINLGVGTDHGRKVKFERISGATEEISI
jgi:hypothetical protein